MLLVGRRDVAGALEEDARRVAAAQGAAQAEFEIFKAFDGFRSEVGGRPRILEVARVRQLPEVLDRLVELLGRNAVLRELFAECFGVGEALRCFSAELLRVVGSEALARQVAAARHAAAVLLGAAVSYLLAVAALLPAILLAALLTILLAALLPTLLAGLLSALLTSLLPRLLAVLLTALLAALLSALLTILLASLLTALLPVLLSALLSVLLSVLLPVLLTLLIALRSAILLLIALLAVRLLTVLLTAGLLSILLTVLAILLARLLAILLAVLLALPAIRAVLLGALTHALVHRLETTHQIARLVGGLRILTLLIAPLRRRLRLLNALTEVGDITGDLLLRLIHPARRLISRRLLRIPQLLLDLAAADRVGRVLEGA